MKNFTINAVGDFILARRMHDVYERMGLNDILNDTLPLLKEGDLNICNLETVICNAGSPFAKQEKNPYYFRCSTRLVRLLLESEMDLVLTGNNHTMDFGPEALQFQGQLLDALEIAHVGSGTNLEQASKPIFVEVADTTIAIISFSCVKPPTLGATESSPGVFYIENIDDISTTLAASIKECSSKADLTIVSPHWTENWVTEPPAKIREQARKLIDLGCDAILGHSSHLVLGIEIYRGKPIVYDMGTFLIDTIAGNTSLRKSGLFQLSVENKRITRLDVYPVLLDYGKVALADESTYNFIYSQILSLDDRGFKQQELVRNGRKCSLEISALKEVSPPSRVASDIHSNKINKNQRRDRLKLLPQLPPAATAMPATPPPPNDFQPIDFQNGLTLLGYQGVESFRTGSGYLAKLAFKVEHPINSNLEIEIHGISNYGSSFKERHPVSHGIHNSRYWVPGQVVVDETFVRVPRRVQPGLYEVSVGFYDTESGQLVPTMSKNNVAQVAKTYVLPEFISNRASGLDWDGKLTDIIKKKFEDEYLINPERFVLEGVRRIFAGEARDFEKNFSPRALENKYRLDCNKSMVYLTAFEAGRKKLRWGSIRKDLKSSLSRNIERIMSRASFASFDFMLSDTAGVLLEIVTDTQPIACEQLLQPEELFAKTSQGFKFKLGDSVDTLMTQSECQYYHIRTRRQKIVYALVSNGVSFGGDLDSFLAAHQKRIAFADVIFTSHVLYKGMSHPYTPALKLGDILYG